MSQNPAFSAKKVIITCGSIFTMMVLVVAGIAIPPNSDGVDNIALAGNYTAPLVTDSSNSTSGDEDRIIVKFKAVTSDNQKKKIISDTGSLSSHIKDEKLKLPNEVVIKANNPKQKEALVTALNNNPNIEYAELDSKQTLELVTNDPIPQWHQQNISTQQAWDSSTGKGVLVAVCDTGVQRDHPDLQANLRADLGYNIYTGTNSGWDILEHPHGTMVSGAVAAVANNSVGIAGVAFDAQIMPLKVTFDASGSTYLSYLSSCIKYAADQGAKVINVSFTGAGSSSIDNAATYANTKGSTVVFAAGNSGKSLRYTNYSSIISVSATDESNRRAYFSDYGKYVDISAPGTNIATTTWNSQYSKVDGTSFAAPIVSANIALALSLKPTLTPSQVFTVLATSSDDLGVKSYDTQFGWGKVNATKIVNKVKTS